MKTFLSLLICFFGLAVQGQSIITATVTFTNTAGTTSGQTFSVNGYLRTWTNNVQSANTQIATATNITLASSNLFLSYASFPQPQVIVTRTATNIVQFQSYLGFPMSVAIGGIWASVSLSTNTPSLSTIVRVPLALAGSYERTNVETGLIDYVNDYASTNYFKTNSAAFRYFVFPDLVGLTNMILTIGANGTNFTVATSNGIITYIDLGTTSISNVFGYISNYMGQLQYGSQLLTNLTALGITNFNNYLDASGNIVLTNGDGAERFRANQSGELWVKYETGSTMITHDTDHNSYWMDASGYQRIGVIDNTGGRSGNTFMRNSQGGHDSLAVIGTSEAVNAYQALSTMVGVWPATVIGTVTNFFADAPNSGTGETAVNSFDIPANALSHDGDSVTRTVGVSIASGTPFPNVKLYFGSSSIFDTGTMTISGASVLSLTCEVTRDGTASARYNCRASGQGITSGTFVSVGKIASGLDFTSPITFKSALTAGSGGSSSQMTIITDSTRFHPVSTWSGL